MKDRTPEYRERLDAHVFVCTTDRDSEYASCGAAGAEETLATVKDWLRDRDAYWSPVGVSSTSCLGLCSEHGTAITIQPHNEWYSDVQPEDVPGLLESAFGPNAERVSDEE
ncbi:(2Fe-2S) ferredoxin domain-containing protein [Halopiger djelfimassiliensis]|uniref:(2Fe-2S) ferredoxin domain-containing protein n=1 Tax=Halopiger djelfimassiliensis TaxID=1293047 RepID=UPI0006782015|nr:(2Fe-2S) ferredoxin domain-containing protein [Halopiger djelfimassiliensis]